MLKYYMRVKEGVILQLFIKTVYKDYSTLQDYTVTSKYKPGTGIRPWELFEIPQDTFENLFEKTVNLEEEINFLLS
jgi:hypothetical protein